MQEFTAATNSLVTTVQVVQPQPQTLTDTIQLSREPLAIDTETYERPSCTERPVTYPHLLKRLYSMLSPAKSPNKCTPSQKRLCVQPDQEKSFTLADFRLTEIEFATMKGLREMSIDYVLQKQAATMHKVIFIDLQTYYSLSQDIQSPECSNIIHYTVLDQKRDDKETLLKVISDLHTAFIHSGRKTYILLEGDLATYERLQSIKREYGNDLKWLFPFPGDWHFLKNYQEVLLKVYYDAGLCDLAKSSGYHTNSVGSNFRRTHFFCWRYGKQFTITKYMKDEPVPNIIQSLAEWIKEFPTSQNQQITLCNFTELLTDISDKHGESEPGLQTLSDCLFYTLCKASLTCKFGCSLYLKTV